MYHPSTGEAEAEGSQGIGGWPGLHTMFQARQGYIHSETLTQTLREREKEREGERDDESRRGRER